MEYELVSNKPTVLNNLDFNSVISFTSTCNVESRMITYVPLMFSFVKKLIDLNEVAVIVTRADVDSIYLAGVYLPLEHEELSGVMFPMASLSGQDDNVKGIVVHRTGTIIGFSHECDGTDYLNASPSDVIAGLFGKEETIKYVKMFNELNRMKAHPKMYGYVTPVVSFEDFIIEVNRDTKLMRF